MDEQFPEGTDVSKYEYNNAAEDHVCENPTHTVMVEFKGNIREYVTPLEVRCLTCGWWNHVAFASLPTGDNPVDKRDDRKVVSFEPEGWREGR